MLPLESLEAGLDLFDPFAHAVKVLSTLTEEFLVGSQRDGTGLGKLETFGMLLDLEADPAELFLLLLNVALNKVLQNGFHCRTRPRAVEPSDNGHGICPDNAITKLGPGRRFEFKYGYCKGCAMCATECPCGALKMVPEQI
jgi:hypothetical protein